MEERKTRKSIRLKEYDYSYVFPLMLEENNTYPTGKQRGTKEGAYFITICTLNRIKYFEYFPELKEILTKEWKKLPNRYDSITLDDFVVMPNHIHGIIIIVGAGFERGTWDVGRGMWIGKMEKRKVW